MSAVVATVCRHAFETLGLVKLTANVFSFNESSARVLKKCGFEQEGFLRKNILKDGEFIDSMVFGRCRGCRRGESLFTCERLSQDPEIEAG